MGRIRSIKPEYPKDELLGAMSRDVRLLFVLLFTLADDEGRFRASPALVRGELFPYDEDLTQHQVGEWLRILDEAGRIRLYVADGQQYGVIVKWKEHQRIDKPSDSKFPAPPREDSPKPPRKVAEASSTPPGGIGREGKGKEKEGEGRGSGEPFVLTSPSVVAVPAAPAAPVVVLLVEDWPEGLRWIPPILDRVLGRFQDPFGSRSDWFVPASWKSLEGEVDSWGHGLSQRFADELETIFAEFQGYWTQRKSKRKNPRLTFRNHAKRWHDRQLGGVLRAAADPRKQPVQRRVA